ncbi:hypothetical protein COCNU_05G010930 [Cocos nucifera]|uniref:Uncharacterized protein n=1 Tax=Cocos nucifera TaxID=13894 RepID=A0A8K0IA69_COCNU|nr:hypothetical protein COCNU_05G010930 [Cocos nucifera]
MEISGGFIRDPPPLGICHSVSDSQGPSCECWIRFSSRFLVFAARDPEAKPSSTAEEIFFNGRILPSYPVFDRNLLLSPAAETERSSSSAASLEVEAAVGEYCVWSRQSAEQCKKSASTGSTTRRWLLRDLMAGRSHSDGKEKFVFIGVGGDE